MYFTKTARKPHFAYESLRYEISTSPNLFRDVPLHYKSNYSGYGYIREKCACNITIYVIGGVGNVVADKVNTSMGGR